MKRGMTVPRKIEKISGEGEDVLYYVATLDCGGEVTMSCTVDLFAISRADRDWLFSMIDLFMGRDATQAKTTPQPQKRAQRVAGAKKGRPRTLTAEQEGAICARADQSAASLAREFGTHRNTIYRIWEDHGVATRWRAHNRKRPPTQLRAV